MPVWRIDSGTDEPHTTLEKWAVMALPNGDRHLVGYALEAREGRVSSRIQEFDPRTLLAKSRSGRVYRLRGRPSARRSSRLNATRPGVSRQHASSL